VNDIFTSSKRFALGILGAGTVGGGLIRLITEDLTACKLPLEIKRVGDRDLTRARSFRLAEVQLTDNLDNILNDPSIDIVVEVLGGLEPARTCIEKALVAGKHVVTANKYVISECGDHLQELANQKGKYLLFEASVAGSIPIIAILNEQIIPDRVQTLHAILNGTSNFILTRMAEAGEDYEEALQKAQQLGFSEPDPSFDVSGKDAGQKLAILISLLKQQYCHPSGINLRGIEFLTAGHFQFAAEHQMIIKPLSIYEEEGSKGFASVEPVLLPRHSVFANDRNEYNVLMFKCPNIGQHLLIGKGAGELPTASAIYSDLRKIILADCSGRRLTAGWRREWREIGTTGNHAEEAERTGVQFSSLMENPHRFHFYVSCLMAPESSLKRRIREQFASVGELIQEQRNDNRQFGLNILTERISHADLHKLIEAALSEGENVKISWIRILQEI
jgi:homoserine dehydrogenase